MAVSPNSSRGNVLAPCTAAGGLLVSSRARVSALALLSVAILLAGCQTEEGPPPEHIVQELPPTPAQFIEGEQLYDANCARCHGLYGRGTELGPALVHRVYEPRHHGDEAFHLAVRSGVIAHHWRFGNMPPVPHVSPEQVDQIIGYVRWMQREAGIE
jgi:mono/diheme cytochrome c family protein